MKPFANIRRQSTQPSIASSGVLRDDESPLMRLPAEVWHCICDFLDVVDEATLKISCPYFYGLLGTSCMREMRKFPTRKQQRLEFLNRLSPRFASTHDLCELCLTWHTKGRFWLGPAQRVRGRNPHSKCYRKPDIRLTPEHKIPIDYIDAVANMANSFGPQPSGQAFGLLHKTELHRKMGPWSYSSSFLLACGRLLLRVQYMAVTQIASLEKNKYPTEIDFCPHVSQVGGVSKVYVQKFVEGCLESLASGEMPRPSAVFRCARCPTELQTRIERMSDTSNEVQETFSICEGDWLLIHTKWIDFGAAVACEERVAVVSSFPRGITMSDDPYDLGDLAPICVRFEMQKPDGAPLDVSRPDIVPGGVLVKCLQSYLHPVAEARLKSPRQPPGRTDATIDSKGPLRRWST